MAVVLCKGSIQRTVLAAEGHSPDFLQGKSHFCIELLETAACSVSSCENKATERSHEKNCLLSQFSQASVKSFSPMLMVIIFKLLISGSKYVFCFVIYNKKLMLPYKNLSFLLIRKKAIPVTLFFKLSSNLTAKYFSF